jgi:Domain of unknown function (DUF4440)
MQQRNIIILYMCLLGITGCSVNRSAAYKPGSPELYRTIVQMDSLFFDAYNNCNLNQAGELLSDNIEFYHDQGGLSTSKPAIMEALKNNICGKTSRELEKNSIEVYAIKDYGAVEMGRHRFHNKIENSVSAYAKFVHIWRHENGKWKMTRIISLHASQNR